MLSIHLHNGYVNSFDATWIHSIVVQINIAYDPFFIKKIHNIWIFSYSPTPQRHRFHSEVLFFTAWVARRIDGFEAVKNILLSSYSGQCAQSIIHNVYKLPRCNNWNGYQLIIFYWLYINIMLYFPKYHYTWEGESRSDK